MEFDLWDYVKMQNQIYMDQLDYGPHATVRVYGDDGEHKDLQFWYSPEDQCIVDECRKSGARPFFVKAYDPEAGGRDGINIQTGDDVNFRHLGYVARGTIAVRRLFALNANGWTLQFLDLRGLTVVPRDDNHLNLRRNNLMIAGRWDQMRECSLELAGHLASSGMAR